MPHPLVEIGLIEGHKTPGSDSPITTEAAGHRVRLSLSHHQLKTMKEFGQQSRVFQLLMCVHNLLLSCFFVAKICHFQRYVSSKKLVFKTSVAIFPSFILKSFFFSISDGSQGVGVPGPDVGLRYILLCATRTHASQIWFRTHLHTPLDFEVIAPADKLTLFIILEIF